ncbi:MAG TPA: M36 family metallopeptidase [Acidobacteriota bacterium]|nr:M36 family metallopeptidase [Acidobacteriota bacterium]
MKKLFLFLCFLSLLSFRLSAGPADSAAGWKEFVSSEGSDWNPHFQNGHLRSLYGQSKTRGASPQEASALFLDKHAELLGIDHPLDLELESSEENDLGTRLVYRQYYGGFKVVGGEVVIHTNKSRQIIGVANEYKPGIHGLLDQPRNVDQVRATVSRYLGGKADVSIGELMVYPMAGGPRLVWRVEADSTVLSRGSWLMYVDASNPRMVLLMRKTYSTAEGQGNVFLENPVVTPTRSFQTFKNMDGSKKLSGSFAVIHDANFNQDVATPIDLTDYTTASDPGRRYDYPTSDGRLSEAMAYFHINRVHDRWRSFGFQKLNAKAPVFVNVAEEDGGVGLDNAYYSRAARYRTGIYVFGAGHELENLCLDADVYYHEYGHGVLDHTKPGLFEAIESSYPGSFHEGFGDISDAAITGDSKIGEWGLRLKATKKFTGRDINNTNSYPQNVILPPTKKSEVHFTGMIVSGAWWDLQKVIGADKAQNILFKALSLMPNEMDFFDFRDGMITADRNLNGGANANAILAAFTRHGLGGTDPGQPGSLTVTTLKAGAYNVKTGKAVFKTKFKRGDTIVVVANYRGTGLAPGWNVIPVDVNLNSPAGTPPDGFLFLDEAVNGSRTGNNGAFQGVLFTDSGTATGQYTVMIQSRLGGTSQTSPRKTVKFSLK